MADKLKKWQLISKQMALSSKYFPVEKRQYRLPDGRVVDDFYVTTLADSAHIIPILTTGEIVMIKIYKQGVDDFIIQFPAGRFEAGKHRDLKETAVHELAEETGIKVNQNQLVFLGKLALASTKASEEEHIFLVDGVEFNARPHPDNNEEIEILLLQPEEIDKKIRTGEIYCAPTVAAWHLARSKYLNSPPKL